MASTAKKLKNAEEKIVKAQKALDKTQTGLRAAEEVAAATEKVSKKPILIALALLTIVGVIWMVARDSDDE